MMVKHYVFQSTITKHTYNFHVYLPADYDKSSKAYPVIYGFYGIEEDKSPGTAVLNLITAESKEEINPNVIVVFFDVGQFSDLDIINSSVCEEVVIRELLALIDEKYRTIASREGRAVEGFSIAGAFALKLAVKYPDMISSVISYCCASMPDDMPELIKEKRESILGRLRIRIVTGIHDSSRKTSDDLHFCLDRFVIPHQYIVLRSDNGHFNSYYNMMGSEGMRFHDEAFGFAKSENIAMPGEDTVLVSNLEYAYADDKPLLLDLYLPRNAQKPYPVIVWIHGGGWMYHSKEYYVPVQMVDKGFAVASIGYRLSHQAVFPAQLEDCKSAIRWLKSNASKYGLDAERFGAWGNSAGGHLAALLGTTGDDIKAVCTYYAPVDFLKMNHPDIKYDHDSADSAESRLLGMPAKSNPEKAAAANPISYISEKTPPFLIIHGDKDELVHYSQSIMLYESLKKAGVNAELHIIEGAGHGFELGDMDTTFADDWVEAFFSKYLKK